MKVSPKIVCSILAFCIILLNCSGCSKVNKLSVTTSTSSQSDGSSEKKQADLSSWLGFYRFFEISTPTNPTGITPCLYYTLKIYKNNGLYCATLTMVGTQADFTFQSNVVGNNRSVKILFNKTIPNNAFPTLKTGDVLFRLEKKNNKLYTTFVGIPPLTSKVQKEGQYFKYYSGRDTDPTW
jgi:hypothetical protein